MKILLTGAQGQLGWELLRTVPPGVTVVACGSAELDISDALAVAAAVATHAPAVIVNAAAYTAVDRAEAEALRAEQVNAQGPANLAQAAVARGIRLVHVSTDFIFDGRQSHPYRPVDQPNPLGVYGRSKLHGEEGVMALTGGQGVTIIRTAWVYSSHGHNFVKTMLRLMAEREALAVIDDQIGTPTWAHGLAQAVWSVVSNELSGVYHYTDAGVASWYDFAVAICEEAMALGLLTRQPLIRPIPASAYPLPAQRPPYGVLDKTEFWQALSWQPSHWRVALRSMLAELL